MKGGVGVVSFPKLYISSSWDRIRLHTENELLRLSGGALTVYVVGGWGGPTNNPNSGCS